jgi:predicted phage tail protein
VLREAVLDRAELAFNDVPEGDYAMRLRAIDGNGLEGYNAQFGFKVRVVPTPPPLPIPAPPPTPTPPRAWLCPLCEP